MPLTAALTYGHDLGGHKQWNFRELDHNDEPNLFWYTGRDFCTEATKVLRDSGLGLDVEIVRYGDKTETGYILAASADVEAGPVSRPFSMSNFTNVDLAEHDARLTAALTALGITPTEIKYGHADPTPAKPGWMMSAYQS